jgi:hypothetical protein
MLTAHAAQLISVSLSDGVIVYFPGSTFQTAFLDHVVRIIARLVATQPTGRNLRSGGSLLRCRLREVAAKTPRLRRGALAQIVGASTISAAVLLAQAADDSPSLMNDKTTPQMTSETPRVQGREEVTKHLLSANRWVLLSGNDVAVRSSVGATADHSGLIKIKGPPYVRVLIVSLNGNCKHFVCTCRRYDVESMAEFDIVLERSGQQAGIDEFIETAKTNVR